MSTGSQIDGVTLFIISVEYLLSNNFRFGLHLKPTKNFLLTPCCTLYECDSGELTISQSLGMGMSVTGL
jgi:hypothetical protein